MNIRYNNIVHICRIQCKKWVNNCVRVTWVSGMLVPVMLDNVSNIKFILINTIRCLILLIEDRRILRVNGCKKRTRIMRPIGLKTSKSM